MAKLVFLGIASLLLIITGFGEAFVTSEETFWGIGGNSGFAEPTPTSNAIVHLVHCFGWLKVAIGFALIGVTDANKGISFLLGKTPLNKYLQKGSGSR